MKRGRFIAAAAATAAGGIAARAGAQVITQQPILPQQQYLQQLTIAVNVTLSGTLGKYGQEVVKGVQAAVDEQNRFNAPISHVWGMRALDDRNDPGLAASNANVAAADFTVIGMIGNLTAPMTLAALSRYANMGFAVIVPTVTADAVTKRGYHNVYRLPAKDSTSGRLFARSALDGKRGVPAIAVSFDGDYGNDVANGFVAQAKMDRHPADVLIFPLQFNGSDPSRSDCPRSLARLCLPCRKERRDGADRRCAARFGLHRRFRRRRRLLQLGYDREVRTKRSTARWSLRRCRPSTGFPAPCSFSRISSAKSVRSRRNRPTATLPRSS